MEKLNRLKSNIFSKKNFWNYVLILIGFLFFLGGLGLETNYVQHAGVLVGVLLLLLSFIWNKKIVFPRGMFLYIAFLILFGLSIFWSKDRQVSYEYLVLFLSGGLFWVSFYNLQNELLSKFDKLIIALGLIFGGLFIVTLLMSADVINSKSLYLQTSGYKNHNHLGDLWAVVILVVSYYLIKTKNRLYWLIVIPGIYFLAISLSRAAYLALFLGAIYLFTKLDWLKKYNKAALLIILITTGFFIFAGAHKITLLSRPYFIQGIAGTIHNPLGVGVGNFKVISLDRANHYWEMSWFSSTAHNIILEMLVGMGVLGSVFIAWLVFVSKDIWANNGRKRILYQSLFVALGVNFLFGTTYFIPTMLWLWFGCLGLTQKKAVK